MNLKYFTCFIIDDRGCSMVTCMHRQMPRMAMRAKRLMILSFTSWILITIRFEIVCNSFMSNFCKLDSCCFQELKVDQDLPWPCSQIFHSCLYSAISMNCKVVQHAVQNLVKVSSIPVWAGEIHASGKQIGKPNNMHGCCIIADLDQYQLIW